MSTRYALPGMMVPDTPKYNARIFVGPWENTEVLIFREPLETPEKPVEWWASLQGFGRFLIKQEGAASVITREIGLDREYWFQTEPGVWPPGTHEFEFHIGNHTERRWVTQRQSFRGYGLEEEWVRRFTEVSGDPEGTTGLLLYNPETGLNYTLGVVGPPGVEQITLNPEGS